MTSTQPTLHRDRLIRLTLLMSLIAVAVVIAMNRTRSHPTAANTIQTAVGSELPPTTTAPTNDVDIEWGILAIAASEPAAEGCEAHYQASQNIVVHGDAYAPGTAIQISFDSNATDERNFSHALLRRIKAENLLDTMTFVTETKDKFQGLPVGSRAVQLADQVTIVGGFGGGELSFEPAQRRVAVDRVFERGPLERGGLLRDVRDAPARRVVDLSRVGVEFAAQEREQARLPRAVRADQAHLVAGV